MRVDPRMRCDGASVGIAGDRWKPQNSVRTDQRSRSLLDGLTLDQIRMFVAVAEAGSFRRGAGRVLRAQSAVSHAVANLESQLGVALFDRRGRRPSLTDAGRALLEDARGVLLKVDVMRARARGLDQGVETELAVVVDTLYPLPAVGPALHELRETYPAVRVRLSVLPLGGPLAALRDERCALAIMAGEDFFDPRIECEHLLSFAVVAVAAATHPLAALASASGRVGVADLVDHLQVVLEDPTPFSEGRDFGVISPQTLRVGSQDAKRALILAGLGWGRLPHWSVERELAEGKLVQLPVAAWGLRGEAMVRAYLGRRMDQALGPAAQRLRDALLRSSQRIDATP